MSAPSVRAALAEIMALIDEGWLVRNTTNDGHFPSYLRESARLVKALAAAQEALATPDPAEALAYALAGMLKWLDSPPVRASLDRAQSLTLTHPHLGVPIPKGFGEWAAATIATTRQALAAYTAGRAQP